MCDLTVCFYVTSNGVERASIIDNTGDEKKELYMSQVEAREYLAGREYQEGHENNPASSVYGVDFSFCKALH